jgi:hypothetical protein
VRARRIELTREAGTVRASPLPPVLARVADKMGLVEVGACPDLLLTRQPEGTIVGLATGGTLRLKPLWPPALFGAIAADLRVRLREALGSSTTAPR